MEEHIGKVWNNFLRKKTDRAFSSKEILFDEKSRALKIFYHLMGGQKAQELHVTDKRLVSRSRTLLEKISGFGSAFYLSWQDERALYLPASIAYFDDKELNQTTYFWLTAMAAVFHTTRGSYVQRNLQASKQLVERYSGFAVFYEKAVRRSIEQRQDMRDLHDKELLFIDSLKLETIDSNCRYSIDDIYPFGLWIYPPIGKTTLLDEEEDEEEPQRAPDSLDKTETLEMKKQSNQMDDKKESDGLLMFLPDSLMSILEQVNVDRSEDDSFDEDALYNAQDLDEITLGRKKANLSARIKMDLDVQNNQSEQYPVGDGHFIDEWDYKKETYLKNYVRIRPIVDINIEEIDLPKRLKKAAKRVQNEFDFMQLDRLKSSNLDSGDDINLYSYLEFKSHQNRSLHPNRFYESFYKKSRDVATLMLADISLSTEAGITQELRIIDVIKDSLMLFCEALQRLDDKFAIYAFSSLKNSNVRFHIIKNFKQPYSSKIRAQIDNIKPGYYTRLGAAIRESSKILKKQPHNNKLLLIISDGKPNDVDRYDGRYGIEDTKKAILEAKKLGITPFCVTVDTEAKEYLPYLFGRGGYTLIRDGKKLPKALPQIYINLTKQ